MVIVVVMSRDVMMLADRFRDLLASGTCGERSLPDPPVQRPKATNLSLH